MSATRFTSWTLLVAAGFALLPTNTARGRQDKNEPQKAEAYNKVSVVKNWKTIPEAKRAEADMAFLGFAQWFGEYVKYPRVYTFPQDFIPDPDKGKAPVVPPRTIEQLITEMNQYIWVPVPGNRVGSDQADYIRGLGKALDTALKRVIQERQFEQPEQNAHAQIIRINATRLLAAACRSGAPAHYPTVTEILDDKDNLYPPEVKYFALQAAANLLAAYDPADFDPDTRANRYRSRRHTGDPAAVARLVDVLIQCVENPDKLVPPPTLEGKPIPRSRDQLAVLAFFRIQAVRALGQVRFAVYPGVQPDKPLYPAYSLARVAVGDPAIVPPVDQKSPPDVQARRSMEAAEAVIGFCNKSPQGPIDVKVEDPGMDPTAAAEVVARGLIAFAGTRAANTNNSLPWRGYAARLTEALRRWRPFFDPNFDPTRLADANFDPDKAQVSHFDPRAVPDAVRNLVTTATTNVLGPIERPDSGILPQVQELRNYITSELAKNQKGPIVLFRARPNLTIPRPN